MVRGGRAGDPGLTMSEDRTPNGSGSGPEDPTGEQPGAAGGGPEDPTSEQPTTQQPPREQPTAQQPAPRRLYRSRTDRIIAGVCSGIARYFAIDPVVVRVAAVTLVFLGGTGLIAYVAAWLLMPKEPAVPGGEPEGPRRGVAIAGVILLIIAIGVALPLHGGWWAGWSLVPLGLIALAGLLVWRLASGQRPEGDAGEVLRAMGLGVALIALCLALAFGSAWAAAAGGNAVVAVAVILAGIALIAGAFMGPQARWMILPALAVALPAGVVAAAGIDVKGGYGDKIYSPASIAAVRNSYRLGAGKLVVDLRGAHLTPGDHPIKLRLGVGEAQLIVPRNVCVSTNSHLGIGGVQVFNHNSGGIDFERDEQREAPAGMPRVVVDANIGVGAFMVHHRENEGWNGGKGNGACL
jgi:phage shock protein PspC (stress-responsive transcriptional regulator)